MVGVKEGFKLHLKLPRFNIRISNQLIGKWVECSPIVQQTWVQSPVESYQRL